MHRRSHRLLRPIAIGIVALAVLAGCSSDDGEETPDESSTTTEAEATDDTTATTRPPIDPAEIEGGEEAYVEALLPQIEGSTGLEADEADRAAACLAPRWVEIIGVEGFAAAGVAPDDLDELDGGLERLGVDRATAEAMVAAFEECEIDLRRATVAQVTADPSITDEQRSCIDGAITLEAVQAGLVASLTGETGEDAELIAAVQECFAEG